MFVFQLCPSLPHDVQYLCLRFPFKTGSVSFVSTVFCVDFYIVMSLIENPSIPRPSSFSTTKEWYPV